MSVIARVMRKKGLSLTPEEELHKVIGDTIRTYRKDMNLTLKQMARRTGLSVSLLSQIERAETSAAISSLCKISFGLGVKIRDLFLGGQRKEAVAAVPDAMVDQLYLIGPPARIREQFQKWKGSGATTLRIGSLPKNTVPSGIASTRPEKRNVLSRCSTALLNCRVEASQSISSAVKWRPSR